MTDQTTLTNGEAPRNKEDFMNRVWTDPEFRARLERDPKSVLSEMGGKVPADVEIKVVSDTDTVKYLHIPSPPPEGEISDEDLMSVQGGTTPALSAVSIVILTIYATVNITSGLDSG